MDARTVVSGLGAGAATFLIVAVLVIELLNVEFSAIVGLPVGLLVGAAVFVVLVSRYESLSRLQRVGVDSVAGFGGGVLIVLAASYVNVIDPTLEFTIAIAVVLGFLTGVISWWFGAQ